MAFRRYHIGIPPVLRLRYARIGPSPLRSHVVTLLALLVPTAHAHATALLEGLDVQDHALGGAVVEASFGVLWQEPQDDAWHWICHEAVTQEGAVIAPRYAFAADGAVLAVVPALEQAREPGSPVYRSDDRCDWLPVVGLADVPVIDAAADPTDPARAVVIASDVAGGSGGSIHQSIDGGRTFETVLSAPDRYYRSVTHTPTGEVWVAAAWYDTPGAWALHSTDGGRTWREHALPLPSVAVGTDVDADVLLADESGAWFAIGPFRDDRLVHVTSEGVITDLAEPGLELTDLARSSDGTLWLAGNADTYLRLDDTGTTVLEDAPTGQGVQVVGDVLRLALRSRLDGTQLVESTDRGETFTPTFHLSELQPPPVCPVDSPVAMRCDPLWEALEARLPLAPGEQPDPEPDAPDRDDTADIPPTDEDGEEKARCGGGSAAVLLLPLVLAARRRR